MPLLLHDPLLVTRVARRCQCSDRYRGQLLIVFLRRIAI